MKKDKLLLYINSKSCYYICFILTLAIYTLYIHITIWTVDFNAINGDFQNYNVIRRFLAGQTPYKDFVVYLGAGHLWLTSIFTYILGGTFGASVVSCNMLSCLIIPLVIFAISRCIYKYNGVIPLAISLLIIAVSWMDSQYDIIREICRLFRTGGSARGIRGLILPISAFLCWQWLQIVNAKIKHYKYNYEMAAGGFAVISGCSLVWGNDYGPCVMVAIIIMVSLISFIRTRSLAITARLIIIMIAFSIASCLLAAVIASKGHLIYWLDSNFEFAGYQKWYYNIPSSKISYLYELDFSIETCLSFIITCAYLIVLAKNKASNDACIRYGIPAFCNLTVFGASQEYQLFSGGGQPLHEVLCLVIFTTMTLELLRVTINVCQNQLSTMYRTICCATITTIIIAATFKSISDYNKIKTRYQHVPMGDQYEQSLDGVLVNQYADVSRLKSFLTNNPGKIFSTYSSVSEVITNQFQPSGIDYVIHAMSDKMRAHYLNSLELSTPDYVSTIIEEYPCGKWIRNANWFVYRMIYYDYHIVFQNDSTFIWAHNASGVHNTLLPTTASRVTTERLNESTVRITIKAEGILSGIADVKLSYMTSIKPSIRSNLITNSFVGIYPNGSENEHDMIRRLDAKGTYCLRPTTEEYIPIEIIDEQGTILLTSYPQNDTQLQVNSVSCEKILALPKSNKFKESQSNEQAAHMFF